MNEITYQQYYIENNQDSFLSWCLKNELYKTGIEFNSRMKNIYTGERLFDSLSAVIAFHKEIPIGIILCENDESYQEAFLLKDRMKRNSRIERVFDWGFYNLGMLSIYVKNEYRGSGIATQLVKEIEAMRIASILDIKGLNNDSVLIFQAKELAFDIVSKKSNYTYVTELSKNSSNYRFFIDNITHGILEKRMNEPYPLVKLPFKKDFNTQRKKLKIG